jgi:Ca2+-binding EF-hand superfamily protein
MVFAIDKYLPDEELRLMFDYIDSDKEGTINRSELRACFS